MRKILNIIIILIIGTNFSLSQNKNENITETQKFIKIQDNLIFKVNRLENRLNSSEKHSDSLNKNLLFYKAQEDFYSTSLSNESNRFALIVSSILALFALLSFSVFKYEIARIKKDYKEKFLKQKKTFNKHKKRLTKTQLEMSKARGNLSVTIGLLLKKEKNFSGAFFYYLRGAKDRLKDKIKTQKDKDFKVLRTNLESAKSMLNKITTDEDKKDLLDQKEIIERCINKISRCKHMEVKKLNSEILLKYLEMTENIA